MARSILLTFAVVALIFTHMSPEIGWGLRDENEKPSSFTVMLDDGVDFDIREFDIRATEVGDRQGRSTNLKWICVDGVMHFFSAFESHNRMYKKIGGILNSAGRVDMVKDGDVNFRILAVGSMTLSQDKLLNPGDALRYAREKIIPQLGSEFKY